MTRPGSGHKQRRRLALASALAVGATSVVTANPTAAANNDVIINEIMYHPTDAVGVEFLELLNTGSTPVDLAGWCLVDGIDLCFPAGTPPIIAGGYALVTDDLAGFAAAYPGTSTPIGQYDGGLKNGGETVSLIDAGGAEIDSVPFDDEAPWPLSPDGNGPSLEVVDSQAPNDVASNWQASSDPAGHTAGFANSIVPGGQPGLTEVTTTPAWPQASQDVVISARLTDANSAQLFYRLGFDPEVVLDLDDGAASVGGAGDGVWSAAIPRQQDGTLIRYRFEVASQAGQVESPSSEDSINYHGITVRHNTGSGLPVIEWFMEDAVYEDMLANHRQDDYEAEAIIAYDGVVYDNSTMRIRGNSSRTNAKVNWKVELPKGHVLAMPGYLVGAVDEFNLQGDRFPVAEMGWLTAAESGEVHPDYFKVRTQRNGEYWSIGSLSTSYDGTFRDDNGYGDWAVYKAQSHRGRSHSTVARLEDSGDWSKKERKDEDYSDLWELTAVLDAPASPAQQAWMWENLDVPRMINYAAVLGLLRHSDSSWYNYYVARDSADTGRWEMWMWDIDQIFVTDSTDHDGDFLTPAANEQKFMVALMNYPEFRQMYMRRLRTLQDQYLDGPYFEDLYDSIAAGYPVEAEADRRMWGGYSIAGKRSRIVTGLDDRRSIFAANQGPDGSGLIPPTASGSTPVVINEINYDPAGGGDLEFIELFNTSSTESIDLSGWTLSDGVSLTIPQGTVILPNSFALVVAQDSDFRTQYGASHFVVAEYQGGLKNSGETIELRASSGSAVDSLTWSSDAPWPSGAAGNGSSLSRLDANGQTNNPANWVASEVVGGTPGEVNGEEPPVADGPACSIERNGGNVTLSYSDIEWSGFSVRRSVDGSSYYWRTRINDSANGTFVDSDRPGRSLQYRLQPASGISGEPIPCSEGGDPIVPACSFVRDGTNVVVSFSDIEWASFTIRRTVNGSRFYWRTRINDSADGTFIDSDRPGKDLSYRLQPISGIDGDPVTCT